MSQKTGPVVAPDELPVQEMQGGPGFHTRARSLAPVLGLSKLGCRIFELEPGHTGWPRHIHHANEELFIVLEGHGSFDYGDATYPIGPGDVAGATTGPGTAHRIRNTGDSVLRYIAISTMEAPEVLEYPDSGKVGVLAGSAPGGSKANRDLSAFFPRDAQVDYWYGEVDPSQDSGGDR